VGYRYNVQYTIRSFVGKTLTRYTPSARNIGCICECTRSLLPREMQGAVIGCLHDRTNIEQLARRSVVIGMLIRRAGGL